MSRWALNPRRAVAALLAGWGMLILARLSGFTHVRWLWLLSPVWIGYFVCLLLTLAVWALCSLLRLWIAAVELHHRHRGIGSFFRGSRSAPPQTDSSHQPNL